MEFSELSIRVHLDATTASNPLPVQGALPYDKRRILAAIEHALGNGQDPASRNDGLSLG